MPVIVGTNNAETLNGSTDADTIFGLAGNDILNGLDGDDVLDGGQDNDMIFGNGGNDTVLLDLSTGGSDTIDLGDGFDSVRTAGTAGQIRLTFTSAEVGNGNPNDSVAGGLNVRLQAEDGADGLTGPQSRIDDEGITFIAAAGQTFDVRDTGGAQRGNQFEIVVLGTIGADVLTAVQTDRSYYFNGGMGDDRIIGGTANDFLVGGGGNDFLVGREGVDTFLGGGGNDFYFADQGETVIEAANGGADRVFATGDYTLQAGQSIETLSTDNDAGTSANRLVGNELDNSIFGNAGDNILDGNAGADLMAGRGGNDFYFVDNAADVTAEDVGQGGADRVFASVNYVLGATAEVETLSATADVGTTAIDLTGNAFSQNIYGNAGNNVLDGKGGNDVLAGREGADAFAFTSALGANNIDTVLDFNATDDVFLLDDAVFTGLAAGALNANSFVLGTAAADADDRIIYNQATGQLFFDADGNGAGAAVQFASLSNLAVINASDFMVI